MLSQWSDSVKKSAYPIVYVSAELELSSRKLNWLRCGVVESNTGYVSNLYLDPEVVIRWNVTVIRVWKWSDYIR
jgi:hypothetical protein